MGAELPGWRLVRIESQNAFANMAIDEAILTARIASFVPNTVRFYQWKTSAVSIGRFQKIENEVQLRNCKSLGVDVVRRITGGGAVYHDAENEITYSVVAGERELQSQDVATAYRKIYSGLVEALNILGLTADFEKGNDRTCPNLTIRGRKISGSAQCHKRGVVLQHGTLLLDVNLEKMFTLLRVPWATTCLDIVNVAKNKITSIANEIGKTPSLDKVHQALIDGYGKAMNTDFAVEGLTPYERELARRLGEEKYGTEDWNFRGKNLNA